MTMDPNTTLAELATSHPAASRVFHRHGLDYCCGGRRSMAEACRERDLEPGNLLAEIESEAGGDTPVWTGRPLSELIGFILERHHRKLRSELPELVALAAKVEARHADKAGCPTGLAEHLRMVHAAVLDHLEKEEQVLFPLILSGRGPFAEGPVQVMELEHKDHGENLARIRELTHDLCLHPEACTSWKALYLRLDEFEADLMEHIHLENNVLFPRALRG